MIKNEVTEEEQGLIDEAKREREEDRSEEKGSVLVSLWYANGNQALRAWSVSPETSYLMKRAFRGSRARNVEDTGWVGHYTVLNATDAVIMVDWIRVDQVLFEDDDGMLSLFTDRKSETYTLTNRQLEDAGINTVMPK